MKKLLIVIDMQNDFIDGSLGTEEAKKILKKVKDKIENYRSDGGIVLFTRDTHYNNYSETQEGRLLSVNHCIFGTYGWQINSNLDVSDSVIINKPSFGSIELAEYVFGLPDIESIELVGLCTDICVISNAMILKAKFPETLISVDSSCCAGVTPESHINALNAMKMCQITIN